MTFAPSPKTVSQNTYTHEHFGGNFLATKDQIGEDGTFDEAVDALGLESLRYPGGALIERSLWIQTPKSGQAIDRETGEVIEFTNVTDISGYAEQQGVSLTYVMPTRVFVGEETDENGDRFAQVDEEAVREFVSQAMEGSLGGSPNIQAFEIGNEYWGAGEMSAVEYGRVASEMATIIDNELSTNVNADQFRDTDVIVQMGMNYGSSNLSDKFDGTPEQQLAAASEAYGLNLPEDRFIYGSGDVAWTKVNNEILLNEFDEGAEREAVNGVAVHIYSKGDDNPNSRYFELSQIKDTWLQEVPELEVYASEWNLKRTVDETRVEEYGLKQAHEMLNIMEAFDWGGVDAAHVWPVQMESRTGLTGVEGNDTVDLAGEMFRLMKDTLPGTRPLDLAGSAGRETEIEGDTADVHTFYADDRLITYLASTSDDQTEQTVDFNNLVTDTGQVAVTRLGVEEGSNPTAANSPPVLTDENPAELLEDGVLIADLAPHEILVIEMADPTYTQEVQTEAARAAAPDDDLPGVPHEDQDETDAPGSQEPSAGLEDDGGGIGDMWLLMALGVLPLLLLGG